VFSGTLIASSQNVTAEWTVAGMLILGILGLFAAGLQYIANSKRDRMKAQLKYVQTQLRELYGPLLALAEINQRTRRAFHRTYNPSTPSHRFWTDPEHPPTENDIKAWRLWMAEIWLPNDIRMTELIMAHGELVIQNGMPECLIDLCAHTLIMKSYLAGLEEGEPIDIRHVPEYSYDRILSYLVDSYTNRKRLQDRLQGALDVEVPETTLMQEPHHEIRLTRDPLLVDHKPSR
jgi:hypothetical protein